jgi:hypothetical protein
VNPRAVLQLVCDERPVLAAHPIASIIY